MVLIQNGKRKTISIFMLRFLNKKKVSARRAMIDIQGVYLDRAPILVASFFQSKR